MNDIPLLKRSGPRPLTHKGMPHALIGAQPVPDVNAGFAAAASG